MDQLHFLLMEKYYVRISTAGILKVVTLTGTTTEELNYLTDEDGSKVM